MKIQSQNIYFKNTPAAPLEIDWWPPNHDNGPLSMQPYLHAGLVHTHFREKHTHVNVLSKSK